MSNPNTPSLEVSLATTVSPPEALPTELRQGWESAYGGIQVEYRDDEVIATNASGHYTFTLTDVPAGWTNARVVHLAFKKTTDTTWTIIGQQAQTTPFFVTRWSTDTDGIEINDVPIQHGNKPEEEDYNVLLVLAHGTGENVKYTCCDPEIHNRPA